MTDNNKPDAENSTEAPAPAADSSSGGGGGLQMRLRKDTSEGQEDKTAPSSPPAAEAPPAEEKTTAPSSPPPPVAEATAAEEATETTEAKTGALVQKILAHKLFRPGLYGVGGIIMLFIVGYVVNSFYVGALLKAGIESVHKGKHAEAVGYIAKYTDARGRSEESDLWLGRAYIFSGEAQQTSEVLGQYSDPSEYPELFYMRALPAISSAPQSAEENLRKIISTERFPYVNGALGIIALLNKKYTESSYQLETARSILSNMDGNERKIAANHMRALYEIYLKNIDRIPEQTLPLPFALPAEPRNKIFAELGLDMGLEGFHNNFIIPFDSKLLEADAEDIDKIFESLYYLSILNEEPEEIESIITPFVERDDISLLTRYITGYYQIANGDYAGAAKSYQRINEKSASAYSQAYEGAALWVVEEGAVPSEQVLAAFDKAVELDPRNLTAQNNRSFMHLYAGNLDVAANAVLAATDINSAAPYVVVNRLAVELVQTRIQKQPVSDAVDLINSAINAFQVSPYILNLAAQMNMIAGRYSSALEHAKKLYGVEPSPAVITFITNIYRIRGQSRVAIATMIDGVKQYPRDESMRLGLLLAQARGGSEDKFKRLVQKYKLSANNPYVLYGKLLLIDETDPKVAIDLARQALDKSDDDYFNLNVLTNLARLYVSTKDVAAAQETLDSAVALNKKLILWGATAENLAAIQARVNTIEGKADAKSIEQLITQAEKHENIISQVDLCWALIDIKEYSLAIRNLEALRQLVAPEASAPSLFQALIIAYKQSGYLIKADDARRQYNLVVAGKYQAAESNDVPIAAPESTDSKEIFVAINSAIKAKDLQRAINLYSQLIDYPDYFPDLTKPAITYQNRGALYIHTKEYKKAADDFSKALEIGGDKLSQKEKEAIRFNYVSSLFRTKDYNKAASEILLLLPGKPPNNLIYKSMQARIFLRQEKFDKAENVYRALIAEDPSVINYYIELARVFRSANDINGGVQVLIEVLEINPNSAKAHREIIKLYKRQGKSDLAARHQDILKTL